MGDPRMPPPDVTLDNCHLEPIHVPGNVQSHGCLLATTTDGRLAWRSANAEEILRVPLPADGERLTSAHFGGDGGVLEAMATASRSAPGILQQRDLVLDGTVLDVLVHFNGRLVIAEFEPRAGRADDAGHFAVMAHQSLGLLRQQRSLDALLDVAVVEVRRLTGFDRVMAYRFRHDASGDIVAESRRDDLEPFLHRRYPASDIPSQARRLYLINTLRLIADVRSRPVPLSGSDTQPLDLSWSMLRSVSPVHIEYLTNMGVSASMSVSIVVGGKLWGMLACHHDAPRHVPVGVRMACDVLAQLLASSVQGLLGQAHAARTERAAGLRARLAEDTMLTDGTPLQALQANGEAMLATFRADALVASQGNETFQAGGLSTAQGTEVLRWLRTEAAGPVVALSSSSELPALVAAELPGWCGVLAVRIDDAANNWVALLRREQVETVQWGGRPEKTYVTGPLGPRLTPRGSFEVWRETVRGSAVPWDAVELDQARALGDELLRASAARQADTARAREQMLAILGHDLRNPLQTIAMASQLLGRGGDSVQLGQRIHRSSSRMQSLISDVLDVSRLQSGLGLGVTPEPADLARIVRESVQDVQLAAPGADVREDVPATLTATVDSHRVAQLLDNLLGNARQHGDPGRPLHVRLKGDERRFELSVCNDAPPIAAGAVAQLFDPFKRQSVGNDRNPQGLGLGLYIASEIARGHGGTLAYSYADGAVCFTFAAPRVAA